jgi:hypothetical protein
MSIGGRQALVALRCLRRYRPCVAYEGQELEGQNGGRLRFVRISEELLEMEAQFSG